MAMVQSGKDAWHNLASRLTTQPLRQRLLTAAALTACMSSLIWCIRDYQEFISLGRGGLPQNVLGWAVVLLLRPITLSKKQAFSTADFTDEGGHDEVRRLPVRKGDRAVAAGIIPHRQITQKAPEVMREKLLTLFEKAIETHGDLLHQKKSLYERNNDAVFVNDELLKDANNRVPETARIARGEVGHMHGDMSVHLFLSPSDAKDAIEKGWAERHRLARQPIFGKHLFRLSPTYLLFYGPRDEGELEIFKVYLENSIRFMTGRDDLKL